MNDQVEPVEPLPDCHLASSVEDENEAQLTQDLAGLKLAASSSSSLDNDDDDEAPSLTACVTTVRVATWNCQQLQFIFKPKRLAEIAQHLATSFDLIFLQEIPTGHYGPYRLNQLVTAMNQGEPRDSPLFLVGNPW